MREVAGAAPSGKCLSSRTPHRWHRPCIFRRRELRREGHRGDARVQRGPHPSDDVRGAAQGHRQHGDPRGRRLDRRDARHRPAARARDLRPQPELRLRRQPENLLRGGPPRRSRHRRHGPPRLPVRPAARPPDHRADPSRRGRRGAGLAAQDGFGAPAGDAVVEVRPEPLPHGGGELGLRPQALRVPHGLPRLPPRGARERELRSERRRLRLRPGDHCAGRGHAVPDRRDRGADALLPRGVVGGVRRLHNLRPPDPGRPLLVHAPPPGPPTLAAFRQPARQVHPPAVTVLARPLDALAAGVLLLAVLVVATGGFTVRGLPINRPEDLLVVLATVVALRGLVAPIALPRVRPARAVAAGVGAYALLMGFVVGSRHAALQTHALDLGYYVQVVWSIAHGHGAYVTLPPMHAWGDHFSPILYLLAPLGRLAPGGSALVLAQTVVLCSGAVAVFVYTARRLHSVSDATRPAAALALLYLVNPSLHGINIRDIHPQAFAIAFLVWAAAAFDARRYGWCALALLLTLGGREDAAIAVVGFGLWLALARRRWALGVTVLAASVLVLLIDLTWVMPYFRGSPYPHLGRYSHLGASLPEILVTLVARPWRWAPVMLTLPKLAYLAAMLAPLGFLPLLAPRALAAALPGLAMNLLSLDPVLFNYRSQYQSFVLPFLVLASVDGYARLRQWRASEAGGGGGARPLPSRLLSPTAVLAFRFLASAVLTARTVNDFM